VLTATDQKPQKSLKGHITQHHVDIQAWLQSAWSNFFFGGGCGLTTNIFGDGGC